MNTEPYRLTDMQPLRDRLLVAPLAVASRTASGLHMPEISHQRERPQHGIVLAMGPGLRSKQTGELIPMDVQVGDCIFYGKYSGQEFELGGQRVLNMSELEVFSRLAVGTFVLVEHDNPKDNHLKGDYCDLCATPEELAAKNRLEAEREQVAERRREELKALNPVRWPVKEDGIVHGLVENEAVEADILDENRLDRAANSSPLEQERERLRRQRQESPA